MSNTLVMTGSEPEVGRFEVRTDGADYGAFHSVDGCIVNERWCSVHTANPNLERVYEILREFGFTIAGERA